MRIWMRWHRWRAASALSFNISFIAFSLTISVDAITNKSSACAGVRGKTCGACLRAKQKCDASWGEVAAENSGFSVFGPTGMALLERLVAGVEKMGTELVKVNKKLGAINAVLHEGAIEGRNCQ